MRESPFPVVFPIEVNDERGGTTQELQRVGELVAKLLAGERE